MEDNWKWNDLLGESSGYRKNEKESNYLDKLIDALHYVCDKEDLPSVEKKFHCQIEMNSEKHNELQFDHYYTITSKLIKAKLYLQIESGIDRGTILVDYSFDNPCKPEKKIYKTLKDVVLNTTMYPKLNQRRKAQAILNRDKHLIFEHERRNSYDNYVTGGNSKMKSNELWSQLHLEYIYEDIEADVNWV